MLKFRFNYTNHNIKLLQIFTPTKLWNHIILLCFEIGFVHYCSHRQAISVRKKYNNNILNAKMGKRGEGKKKKKKCNTTYLCPGARATCLVQTKILYRVKCTLPVDIYRYVLRCYEHYARVDQSDRVIFCGSIFQRAQQVPPPFGGLSEIFATAV